MMRLEQQCDGRYYIYNTSINLYGQIFERPHSDVLTSSWHPTTAWMTTITLELAEAYCKQVSADYQVLSFDFLAEEFAVGGAL